MGIQYNVVPLEMDDQKLAIGRKTPESQLDTWQMQGDVAYGPSQGQVTDDSASLLLSTANGQNHSNLPVSGKLPKKPDDEPPQIFEERLPRKLTAMVVETMEDTQPVCVTNDRVPEVEDDRSPQIIKERPPRKRVVVEEIVENAQLSHIRT